MEEENESGNKDYYVQARVPYLFIDRDIDGKVEAGEEAVSRMVEKLEDAGKEYIDVTIAASRCPQCREVNTDVVEVDGACTVALMVETTVYNAESPKHALDVLGTELDEAMKLRSMDVQVVEEVENEESGEKVES